MKSELLSNWDLTRTKNFEKDFEKFVELPDKIISQLHLYMEPYFKSPSRAKDFEIIKRSSKELDIDAAVMKYAFNITEFFAKEFVKGGEAFNDTSDAIADDLLELKLLPKEKKDVTIRFFDDLKKISQKIEISQIKKTTTLKSVAFLRDIHAVLDYRSVIRNPFSIKMNLDDYKPECLGLIPTAIINLELKYVDNDILHNSVFQVDEYTLSFLIDSLLSLKKDIEATKKFLKLDVSD